MLKKIRWSIEFLVVYIPYVLIRISPWFLMRGTARFLGFCLHLIPGARKLVRENIHAAMPELSPREVRDIARRSFDHLMWNLLEYIWLTGNEKRIRRCFVPTEFALKTVTELGKKNERIIFVNPHMGSWEASGLMAPFYGGVKLAAIAKPVKNPYLNKLLNSGSRESTPGLRIIFSKGAMRSSIKALKEGWSIGTLNDQNTRVRNGGVFVNFFGLPVPSSTAPALLKSYCDQKKIPCTILFACSLRNKEGKIEAHVFTLNKPFEAHKGPEEVLQEFMDTSEKLIRQFPEQYLWLYRRFQHIPEDATPEQLSRYPRYARRPGPNFYLKLRQKDDQNASDHGDLDA